MSVRQNPGLIKHMPVPSAQMFYNGLPEIMKRENDVRFAKAYQESPRKAGIMCNNADVSLFGCPNSSPETFVRRFYTRRMFAVSKTFFGASGRKSTVQRTFDAFGKTDFLLRMTGKNRLWGTGGDRPVCHATEHYPNGNPQYPECVFHAAKVGRSFWNVPLRLCYLFSKPF